MHPFNRNRFLNKKTSPLKTMKFKLLIASGLIAFALGCQSPTENKTTQPTPQTTPQPASQPTDQRGGQPLQGA